MTVTRLVLTAALVLALEGAAGAQAMFTASLGNVFGGDAPLTKSTWAVAIGGGGAHGIGSELEFSQTGYFLQNSSGVAYGRVVTLMPSIFVAVPVSNVRPYGIFGFGFIRQRTKNQEGGLLAGLSNDDVGYSVGGGVIVQLARHAGLRADFRRFKVRTADGISFHRLMFGVVLGG